MPISLFLQTAPAAPAGPGIGAFLFQIGAIFAIFYFLMIRPQQKQRKAHEAAILAHPAVGRNEAEFAGLAHRGAHLDSCGWFVPRMRSAASATASTICA